ncbi:MAG: hypothetical protein AAGC63_15015 [Propionicimonas sp.]
MTRRARGTRTGTEAVWAEVSPEAAGVWRELTAASGLAAWSVLETTLDYLRSETPPAGLPAWWPAERVHRRPRNSIVRESPDAPPKVEQVFGDIDSDMARVIERVHRAGGGAKWFVLQTALIRVGAQRETDGLPSWWPRVAHMQEALPIPA